MASMLLPLTHLPKADTMIKQSSPFASSKDSTLESFLTQQSGLSSPIRAGKWLKFICQSQGKEKERKERRRGKKSNMS